MALIHCSSLPTKFFLIVRIPGGKLGLELVEAKILQHVEGEFQAVRDLVFDLLRRAEDVRVVLGKSAHPQQAVHHARTFVAIHRPQLAQAHRQIAIRLQRVFVDQDVPGTIHGLQAIFRVVKLHGVEHVLRVVALVPRGKKQLPPRHVRGVDQRVAALQVLGAHPVFHLFADDAALGMPENQPRARQLLNRKQIKLLAEHAVVALLGFFELVEIVVEVLFREEGSPVDALQLRVLLVSQPVRARNVEQLERLDLPGRGNMRPAAEVGELAGAVDGNLFIGLGELLDEVALHEVAIFFELRQPLVAGQKFARVRDVLLHQFLHLLLDLFQILGSERQSAGRSRRKIPCRSAGRGPAWSRGKAPAPPRPTDAPTNAGRLPAPRDRCP